MYLNDLKVKEFQIQTVQIQIIPSDLLPRFYVRKFKRMAKFDRLESRRCEDIKRIVAPEIGPNCFATFENQAPGAEFLGKRWSFHML